MKKQHKLDNKSYRLAVIYVILLTICLPLNILFLCLLSSIPEELLTLTSGKIALYVYCALAASYTAFLIILGLLNIIQSFDDYRAKKADCCVYTMLIHKYGLIPFFIINFTTAVILYAGGGIVMLIGSRGTIIFAMPVLLPVVLFLIGLSVIGTWLVLIPGAFYGIQVNRLNHHYRKASAFAAIVNSLLQFVFLIDTLDAMYLSLRKWGKGKKSALCVGALYLLAICGIIYTVCQIF